MEKINKLISMTLPIEIIDSLDTGVVYSHVTSATSDANIEKTLDALINLAGIRSKANKEKFKFETYVDSNKSEITYFYERVKADVLNHEIDKLLFDRTQKIVSSVIDTINTMNKSFNKGVELIPIHDADIDGDFEQDGQIIKYKEKRAAIVINNILNLMPVLPESYSLKSNGEEILFDKNVLIASPIKSRKLFEDTINIQGKIDCAGAFPRRIRIQQNQTGNNKAISEFLITTRCLKFGEIRNLPEKCEVQITLVKSTDTNQYNIDSFELIDSNKDVEEAPDLLAFLEQ